VIIEINNISVNEFALYIYLSILYKCMMNIELTCPICSFSKIMSGEQIPEGVKWAVCPECGHRFEFVPPEPVVEQERDSPWERRMDIGLWQGIYQTFIAVLFSPGDFFKKTKSGKGFREALSFGLLLGSLGYMIGFFWEFLLISAGIMPYSSDFLSQIPINWLFLAGMVLSPVLVILNIFVTGAVIHILMLAFNSGKGGFEGTFKVIAFGQATKSLAFIPFMGGVIGWFWNLVVIITGLKEIHNTSGIKAAAAVIISLMLKLLMLLPVILLTSLIEYIGLLQ
jgi:hypothetical protein